MDRAALAAAPAESPAANGWVQTRNTTEDTWRRYPVADERLHYGYVCAASDLLHGRYHWQAVRGDSDFRLSGIAPTREAAMAEADRQLALPIEEFNAAVAEELIADIHAIEQKLLRLSPARIVLPGYHSGYEAGITDTRRRIEEALA